MSPSCEDQSGYYRIFLIFIHIISMLLLHWVVIFWRRSCWGDGFITNQNHAKECLQRVRISLYGRIVLGWMCRFSWRRLAYRLRLRCLRFIIALIARRPTWILVSSSCEGRWCTLLSFSYASTFANYNYIWLFFIISIRIWFKGGRLWIMKLWLILILKE